jgi:hypothetical protein
MKIIHRVTRNIIYEDENVTSMKKLIDAAVKAGVCLRGAVLSEGILDCSDLVYGALSPTEIAELCIAQTRILPEGSLVGWKMCKNNVIVKLLIPENAKRSSAFGRKCRAEFVDVLEVINGSVGISLRDGITTYIVGERVTANSFDLDWSKECSPGIHFFITRTEAENYTKNIRYNEKNFYL